MLASSESADVSRLDPRGWIDFRIIVAVLLLAVAAVCTWWTIDGLKKRRVLRTELAEISHAKYDLLNVDHWVAKLVPILDAEVDALDLKAASQGLRPTVERSLYQLLDTVKEKMSAPNPQAKDGGLMGGAGAMMANMMVGALKPHVPEYTGVVMAELQKPENEAAVRKYLKSTLADAAKTYTVLTVGDGLVTMIPSLLVSVAGGIVVTRTSSETTVGVEFGRQLFGKRTPLRIAAGVMLLLGLIPGLPKMPFFMIAALMAYLSSRATVKAAEEVKAAEIVSEKKKADPQQQLEALLKLDEISLEVGYALVPMVDQAQGGQLLQRIRALRKHLALQLGFLVPSVHITDNLKLKPREYVVLLRGVEVARWEMQQERLLAISSDPTASQLEGLATQEPAFGASALWIVPGLQEQALASGYAVVDQTSVLATHLAEIVRQFAHELLTRQETKRLLDAMAEAQPKLVDELVPRLLTLGEVQKVLQQLLREQVSIRDLSSILETLLDTATANKNPVALVEAVRQALARSLVQPLIADDRKLKVLALDPAIEQEFQRQLDPQAGGEKSAGGVGAPLRQILEGLQKMVGDKIALSSTIILCNSPSRYHLRRLLEPFLPRIVVLSPAEIPASVSVQTLGVVR